MALIPPRKVLWLAAAGAGCVVLLLLLPPTKPQPRTLDLRIVSGPQTSNGTMLIGLVLSNGTSRSLNIVDDATGKPFWVLDAGANSNMPGTVGFGLGTLANTLKLNLAPGAALTQAVRLTNPPPRFRLLVEVRDLARERQRAIPELLSFLAEKARLRKRPRNDDDYILLPASPWIENGIISTTTPRTNGAMNQAPTNGMGP